jgi:hypothetical protein
MPFLKEGGKVTFFFFKADNGYNSCREHTLETNKKVSCRTHNFLAWSPSETLTVHPFVGRALVRHVQLWAVTISLGVHSKHSAPRGPCVRGAFLDASAFTTQVLHVLSSHCEQLKIPKKINCFLENSLSTKTILEQVKFIRVSSDVLSLPSKLTSGSCSPPVRPAHDLPDTDIIGCLRLISNDIYPYSTSANNSEGNNRSLRKLTNSALAIPYFPSGDQSSFLYLFSAFPSQNPQWFILLVLRSLCTWAQKCGPLFGSLSSVSTLKNPLKPRSILTGDLLLVLTCKICYKPLNEWSRVNPRQAAPLPSPHAESLPSVHEYIRFAHGACGALPRPCPQPSLSSFQSRFWRQGLAWFRLKKRYTVY